MECRNCGKVLKEDEQVYCKKCYEEMEAIEKEAESLDNEEEWGEGDL